MRKTLMVTWVSFVLLLSLSLATDLRAESVKLAWNPTLEPNMAGHNVYRSETPGGPYRRLNGSLVQSPYFVDNTAEINRTYYYAVTSVITGGLESGYSAEVQVVIGSDGTRPQIIAEAGPELVVKSGQTVVLSGSGWDPEGRPLSYSWSQLSGNKVTIIRSDRSEATFVAPLVSQDSYLSLRLTVTNTDGVTAADSVQVTVRR